MKTIGVIRISIIAIVIAATSQTGTAQSSGGGRLAGTWDTVVTIRNCVTGGAIVSFQSVGGFNQGGTFSGIASGQSPAARGPEQGVWAHVKSGGYRFRFKAYLFNAAGVATGYQVVTHDLELDDSADNWSSSGISQFFDMAGTQTGGGCSTAVGSRMVLD